MNKNAFVIGTLLTCSAVFYHWIIQETTPTPAKASPLSKTESESASANTLLPKPLHQKQESRTIKSITPEPIDSESTPEEVSQQFALLSQIYEQELQYPSYSLPLTPNSHSYLEPNHFTEIALPVLDGSHSASLGLSKYRFSYPEPISVTLNSDLNVDHIEYQLIDIETQKTLANLYTQELSVEFSPKQDWPQEVRIKANISFDQGDDVLTADFQFSNPIAFVSQALAPYSQGSDMIIPLQVDVKESGLYRIRANLYQSNGKPVASLMNKMPLTTGEVTFELKAHHSVLKGKGSDFELRSITVEKMSGFPGEKAHYGISKEQSYSLSSFDVSSLNDQPYKMSEEEKERLDFLDEIAHQ
ncbi:hypothetical protein [Aliivibrio fischeri]|uniref:hypothetical protein n=1 Tax=Aliivibrio fischeri TaxID=668 RepID=UPI0012DA02BE|nr:hypothetical protein [Aliivibrio fischeri]MUJ25902.1 hypothetical protein [Aliivibrio fischeri]